MRCQTPQLWKSSPHWWDYEISSPISSTCSLLIVSGAQVLLPAFYLHCTLLFLGWPPHYVTRPPWWWESVQPVLVFLLRDQLWRSGGLDGFDWWGSEPVAEDATVPRVLGRRNSAATFFNGQTEARCMSPYLCLQVQPWSIQVKG